MLPSVLLENFLNGKSIVFVVNCLDIGGAEVQVSRLALGMTRRGWRVAVVSLLPAGPLTESLESGGVEVCTLNMRPGVPNPLAILRLRRIMLRLRPDVVHSHIVHANILSRITRLIAPMTVLVSTAHNLVESGKILELCYRYTDRLGDLTTNVSQAAVDRYITIKAAPADRIRFMPNGLDLSGFSCDAARRASLRSAVTTEDRFIWLAVGRFRVQKDYPNLMRAYAAASKDAPAKSLLLIAGGGPTQDEAKALAVSLNLMDRVQFLGVRSDVPDLMNLADGFVLSSAWEGMPLVLQESAASGLPIVATDVGGNREVALDGKSAFLVPPRDSLALAGAMSKMMALPIEERQKMARAGREHVALHYDIEHVLDGWESIYAELANSVPRTEAAPVKAKSLSG